MKGFCASSAASYRVWLYLKKAAPYGLRSKKRKHLMAMTTALDIGVRHGLEELSRKTLDNDKSNRWTRYSICGSLEFLNV